MTNNNYYQRPPNKSRESAPDYISYNYVNFPWFIKSMLWFETLCKYLGYKPFKLGDSLLKAFDATGHLDERWGSVEELNRVRETITILSESVDNNPQLSVIGRILFQKQTLAHLQNRHQVIDFFDANEDFIISHGRIDKPLIITGFPRTGTTLLQRLMSEDINSRSPFTFELESPLPPLKQGDDPYSDPRIKNNEATIKMTRTFVPGMLEKMAESHLFSATEKEESMLFTLMHNGLHVVLAPNAGNTYIKKYNQLDTAPAVLRYERNLFTLLDAYCPAPSHWLLKAPWYATHFPHIFDIYPDARVVVTHRNPVISMPSICRLFETVCLPGCIEGSFNKHHFAKMCEFELGSILSVPLDFRKKHPEYESQIFDCVYDDFFADPITMMKNIYSYFNIEYTADFEQRMHDYMAGNQQGKHGRHKYSLEEYGFTAEGIYEHHKNYMDHYGYTA